MESTHSKNAVNASANGATIATRRLALFATIATGGDILLHQETEKPISKHNPPSPHKARQVRAFSLPIVCHACAYDRGVWRDCASQKEGPGANSTGPKGARRARREDDAELVYHYRPHPQSCLPDGSRVQPYGAQDGQAASAGRDRDKRMTAIMRFMVMLLSWVNAT
jgi:hypothetical protein